MSRLTLEKHSTFPGVSGPVVVLVLDGVGIGRGDDTDAVATARTPTLDRLAKESLSTRLRAHGTAVGLPSDDDMGNSEVGHNALGAGRIFDQGSKLVGRAIESGALFTGEVWQALAQRVRGREGATLHFLGLLSDGNVHSHLAHLEALLKQAAKEQIKRVRVHALLDGRDVPETSALTYVEQLEALLSALSTDGRDYRVASGGGRMKITMDRYNADWPMVQRGWQLHVRGEGRTFSSLRAAVQTLREEIPGISDQNLPGFVIADAQGPVGPVRDGDAFVLFNFRGDRAIEISRAFEDESFTPFDRGPRPDVFYAGMMQYDGDLLLPKKYLVAPPAIDRTLGAYLASSGITQYASAETQKYGHVTYFWNGNRSGMFDASLERYVEVPSDTRPFEERPWMKAAEVTDALLDALTSNKYRHLRVNYANGDMVGHTGSFESSVIAVEAVDLQVGRILPIVRALNGALLVTADHGNADEMFEWDKKAGKPQVDAAGKRKPKTSHTLNPVPCYIDAPSVSLALRQGIQAPGIGNIAATVLHLLGYQAPEDYLPSLLG